MSLWLMLLLIALFVGAVLFAVSRVTQPQNPVPSPLSATCPVCGGKDVVRKGKTYECTDCHSTLKIAVTRRALWAIPILLGMCAVMLLIIPLRRAGLLTGVWLVGVVGGVSGLGSSLTWRAYLRGFVYRPVNPQNISHE